MIRPILSFIFHMATKMRAFLYKNGIFKSYGFDLKVISVGNTSMGGSGKTPLVLWLAGALKEKGFNVGVVEKGYKSKLKRNDIVMGEKGKDILDTSFIGDEAAMVWDNIPDGVKFCVSYDKTSGVSALKAKWPEINLVIVDDAFQHLKLKRDTDIVLIDSNLGFKDKIFPYGMLRESYSAMKRADLVLFTKSDKLNQNQKDELKEKALKIHSGLKIFFSVTELHTSKDIKGKKILPVCAIYNPGHFLDKLIACGGVFEKYFAYGDHHRFKNSDIKNILKVREYVSADYIVATSKDMPKLKEFFKDRTDVVEAWYEHKINDREEFITCCIG